MFIIMGLSPMREKTADLLNKLSNGNKYSVELQRHKYDFVGGFIGGNSAAMWGTLDSRMMLEWLNMFGRFDGKRGFSIHSC